MPSPAAQPHGVVPRRFICYLRHPFSTSIILSIRPSHRSHTTIHFTSASCGCILCPVSCVLLCVLRPALHLVRHDRICLLCPLIIAQRPLCIAPLCRLCICCTFSVITISDILPQSNSESRSHVSCYALRILCPASCVLRPALRPTMRFVPCVRINIALYLLRRVHAPRLPCATSCTVPHFSVTTLVYPAAQ